MPFLGSRPHAQPSAVIIGAPYDATVTYRPGAGAAPDVIRRASDSIETYSPIQRRDLEDLAYADAGDLALQENSAEAMIARVREAVAAVRGFPVILGGEHTVTVGAVQALADRHPDLAVVVLDAHLDLRDDYEGRRWSHATTVARLTDSVGFDRIAVLGARSGTRDEWTRAAGLAAVTSTSAIPADVWGALARHPLYLSIDIDAFDPAVAPGTGNPEPLGLSVDDFVALLSVLREARIVGCDLVEVSPPCDPSGRTAVLGAWLVREMLVAFVR